MIEIVTYARIGGACIVVAMLMWVTYGFRHGISPRMLWTSLVHWRRATASEMLRASVTTFHIKGVVRIAWWDIGTFAQMWLAGIAVTGSLRVGFINLGFQALALLGAFQALSAQYKMIPEDEQHLYSIWTAPTYPWGKRMRAQQALERTATRAASPADDPLSEARHAEGNARATCEALARAVLSDSDRARAIARVVLDKD